MDIITMEEDAPEYQPDKLNDILVVERIEQEGLCYAVMDYMDETSIQNPETAKLWKEARVALEALSKYLKLNE